ncbi:MAG: CopG family ribbon-helix-helix protein [Sphingomonadaceae bacterium]
MAKSAVITARVDQETLDLVDRVAGAHGRSRGWFAAQAIRQIAEKEAEFLDFLQEGIDAAERGEVYSQEEVERWFEKRVARRRTGIAAE